MCASEELAIIQSPACNLQPALHLECRSDARPAAVLLALIQVLQARTAVSIQEVTSAGLANATLRDVEQDTVAQLAAPSQADLSLQAQGVHGCSWQVE